MTIAAVYARKSTESEKNPSGKSDSVDLQIANARAFAEKRGWKVGEVFSDDGISGATYAMLKGRAQMADAAEQGQFQVLVISEQSRLGREMIESAYFIKSIAETGVDIWTYLDGQRIDVETEIGQALTMLRGFAGAAERSGARKRTRAVSVALAEAGKVTGGRLFGYDNIGEQKRKTRKVNDDQAATVLRIFTMYADGAGHKVIRDTLNAEGVKGPRGKWANTTIRDILSNPAYTGTIVWGKLTATLKKGKSINVPTPASEWKRLDIPEMRIVSDDLWDKVQARREQRRHATPRGRGGRLMGRTSAADLKSEHLLSGLMECAICHGSIRVHTEVRGPKAHGHNVRWYLCSTHKTRGAVGCANDVKVKQSAMETAVLAAVRHALTPDEVAPWLEGVLAAHRERWGQRDAIRSRVERDLADVAKRIGNLVEAVSRGDAPEPLIMALKTEREKQKALESEQGALDAPGGPVLPVRGFPGVETAKAWVLAEDAYRKAVTDHIADVWTLLDSKAGKAQARGMLRRVLAGAIVCTPEPGGYRFTAPLALDRLIVGTSGVGVTRRGRSTSRAPAEWSGA